MKHFAIRRSADLRATRAEIDAGAMQALMALTSGMSDSYDWAPADLRKRVRWLDVRWVRSYWHAGGDAIVCLYTGPMQDVVEDVNLSCGAAFDEILEIIEVAASGRTDPETCHARPSYPDACLFSVECFLPEPPRDDVCADLGALLEDASGHESHSLNDTIPTSEWIRSYWHESDGWLLALYASADSAWLANVPTHGLPIGNATIRPVTEIAPTDYLGLA